MVEAGKDMMRRRNVFDENVKSVLENAELKDFNDVSLVSKKWIYYYEFQ